MNTKRNYSIRVIILFEILTCALLQSCKQYPQPIQFTGTIQGTYYSISYYDNQHRNLQPQIDSLLHEFDLTASLWIDSSIIRRINENKDSVVNNLFIDLLRKSMEMNQYTNGSFDCSVGKLVRRWGFGFQSGGTIPTEDEIAQLRHYMSNDFQILVDSTAGLTRIRKPYPETEIDFNAIAQGYSVDMVGNYLSSLGIESYIIDIGGEVLAKGAKPDGSSWSVGIERPAANKYDSREVEAIITLKDQSVVTSGSYRKYYEKNGVRYSHTIDPTTGHPVEHNLLSASVIADEAWLADALATAFMVMGLERSVDFIDKHPEITGAFFIYDENGSYKTYATEEFSKLIKK